MEELLTATGDDLGEFQLSVEHPEVCAGWTVRGHFAFELRQPVEARKVCVQIEGRQSWTEYEEDRTRYTDYVEVLYERSLYLDGPASYQRGDYPFHFDIPKDAPATENPTGDERLDWIVRAWLDIPWGEDPVREIRLLVLPAGALREPCPSCGRVARKPAAVYCGGCGKPL